MKEDKSRAVLAVTLLLALGLSGADFSVSPDCSPSAATSGPVRLLSAVVDAQRAEQSQRQHLEALFNRYGENGTISLAGLKRLLQSTGESQDAALGKKTEKQENRHNLYDKKTAAAVAAAVQVVTTPVYSTQLLCLNASSILSSHGMSQEVGVTLTDFGLLCPALLNQIDVGACVVHGEDRDHKHHTHTHGHHGDHNHSDHDRTGGESGKNIATAWVGGFVSITIISLLSLLGVVLIPLMNRVFFKFLLSFLVALAVGTLSGDAFLHLIPHSQSGHHHHHENLDGHHGHDEQEENLDAVWKGLTALGGVYFMFLIEHFLTLGKMYKDKKQKVSVVSPQGYSRATGAAAYTAEDCENKCHSHFHDTVGQADSMHHHHHDYHHILHHHHSQNHHPHSHSHSYSEQHFQQAGVATLAWMVIMGDGLHNFSDGLAIGAAFTEGLSSGLSTSVAVFCHELPHELGDFAVLLKAGMTVRQAILYNVLSAMMAYLGMVTGILIGHYADNISTWIFALTAGLFMYVALVDMVPEMLHNDAGDHGFSHWGFFLLQNAGILLGFCIMLLIAIFEHKIQLDLGY
ncbi:hypothetical protein INR49_019984 [Caranx melampygus]|nr:hypothetical protein INR49_019984 [Caranx melampygus]